MSTITQSAMATLDIDGISANLTYHLLTRCAVAEDFDAGDKTEYGVRIELTGLDSEPEVAEAPGITCEESEIFELINMLIAGKVTPMALMDIVDDFLAQT